MYGRSFAATLWRRRWAALISLVLVLVASAAWVATTPRRYTATATVTATPVQSVLSSRNGIDVLEATLARLVNSPTVLMDVRDRVGTLRTVAELRHEVSGRRVGGTLLIRVTVQDRDRVFARDVANAVAEVLPRHDPSGGLVRFADAGRATIPTTFSSPDLAEIVVWVIGLGVLLAVVVALVAEFAGGRVDDPRQLARISAAPTLGTIVRPQDPFTTRRDQDADQFRAVRVALEFASSDELTHTVVVAPVAVDSASAWLALSLAGALAQVQRRVLVIDADFGNRDPHPALAQPGPGLADVLRGAASLGDAVRPSEIPGVCVLPRGEIRTESAATLVEVHFHRVLRDVADVDLILVHAAPLSESDDARVMAAGNALVITVPSGRIRATAMRHLVADLRVVRLRVLGTVLLESKRRGRG